MRERDKSRVPATLYCHVFWLPASIFAVYLSTISRIFMCKLGPSYLLPRPFLSLYCLLIAHEIAFMQQLCSLHAICPSAILPKSYLSLSLPVVLLAPSFPLCTPEAIELCAVPGLLAGVVHSTLLDWLINLLTSYVHSQDAMCPPGCLFKSFESIEKSWCNSPRGAQWDFKCAFTSRLSDECACIYEWSRMRQRVAGKPLDAFLRTFFQSGQLVRDDSKRRGCD